ncbi:hypothetical protein ABPG75_006110 [Micractinium tetrahymenae]
MQLNCHHSSMRTISALVLLVGIALHLLQRGRQPSAPPAFKPVTDGLYSLIQRCQPLPFLPGVPIAVYLVREGSSWALVDAGVPAHAGQLVEALRVTLPPNDTLAAIILTHSHPDHVGALPQLLQAYPHVPVVAHEGEAPFLTGEKHYSPPSGLGARVARWAGVAPETPLQVPRERLHLLEEPLMDFSSYGLEELVYIVTPGHTPGHISLLHSASHTLLAGDALSFIRPSLRRARDSDARDTRVVGTLAGLTLRAEPLTLCLKPSCDRAKADTSFCMLADGMQYDNLLASHDWAGGGRGGWTQAALQAVAASMPRCQELSKLAAEGSPDGDAHAEYEVEEQEEEEDEYE